MSTVHPLIKVGLALTGFPKEKQLERYVSMRADESKKCNDVAKRVFYHIAQFFLTLIGCSDEQIIKRAARSLVGKIVKIATMGLLPREAMNVIKKGTNQVVSTLLKTLVTINNAPTCLSKPEIDALVLKAKEANKQLLTGNFEPFMVLFQDILADAPELIPQKITKLFDGFINAAKFPGATGFESFPQGLL